jgi:hypothetical protein
MIEIDITKILKKDREMLEKTRIPIVTVSASFKHDLAKTYGIPDPNPKEGEVLFSRAHYSMALAAAMEAWKTHVDPKKAWLVDPTNYVSSHDWKKVEFTETVGQLMARNWLLKAIKDLVDTKVRNKLPITDAITTPLLYACERVNRPILSFHYESGNILAGIGKRIVQVVTDPHVRDQYMEYAQLSTMRFCVFDENTRVSFLEKAATLGKKVDPRRVIVTGPPVDPRIVATRKKRKPSDLDNRPIRLCITTGGLGTNKSEIEECVRSLAPLLRVPTTPIHVIIYVGVHADIRESIHQICRQEGIPTSVITDEEAPVRILYSPHIVEANEALIKYAFPWADGFVTKPSGDMAYDAAAAGCFLLTLEPWGEWEHNIRDVFEQKQVSRRAIPGKFREQIMALLSEKAGKSWMQNAMTNALNLPETFTHGTKNILAQMPKV